MIKNILFVVLVFMLCVTQSWARKEISDKGEHHQSHKTIEQTNSSANSSSTTQSYNSENSNWDALISFILITCATVSIIIIMSIHTVGEKLRQVREQKKLPLRKVALILNVDVAILSKMERGE